MNKNNNVCMRLQWEWEIERGRNALLFLCMDLSVSADQNHLNFHRKKKILVSNSELIEHFNVRTEFRICLLVPELKLEFDVRLE